MRHVLTVRCQDRPTIVRQVADGVAHADGNIVASAQFSDATTNLFVMRLELDSPKPSDTIGGLVLQALGDTDATVHVRPKTHRPRTLIMVSKFDHCLLDLLYRREKAELDVDIPVIVSNHPDLEPIARRHGIDFTHLPVTPTTKPAAEEHLLALVDDLGIELVVLARYMQILSPNLCGDLAGRAINIHHSFLPGFKGAQPYRQAHQRGVKLIGATAHYVTEDLDEGPIIEQDVVRVTHQYDVDQLVALGRDVERVVLARAVRHHAEDRVFVAGTRTYVL